MRALIDTNVIMDALADREPYNENGKRVIKLCGQDDIDGVLAAHSLTNLFYLLRKYFSSDELRDLLLNLCDIFEVEGIDREKIVSALKNKEFKDFEDCLQMECALAEGVEYIVTRNERDFEHSSIPCIAPDEFCRMFPE